MGTEKANERKALIFQVIHGSFVDGYGCRTTIFLKGCPLRCKWCCNPESQEVYPEVKYNKDNFCTGCRKCEEVCPSGALAVVKKDDSEEYDVVVNREKCTHCGKCGEVCRTDKLEIYGKYYTVDEIFEEIRKDEKHYDATGGGVTIGGGECTMHGEFTLALVRKCRENYIQTALDTCGFITNEAGLQAFDEADYVLLDIKGIDREKHKGGTGVYNDLILKNLKRRNDMGKPVIVRYPLIPEYNDSEEDLQKTAEFLSHYPVIERIDIIPFHDYSRVKYAELGRDYLMPFSGTMLSLEEEEKITGYFKKYGLKAQIGG